MTRKLSWFEQTRRNIYYRPTLGLSWQNGMSIVDMCCRNPLQFDYAFFISFKATMSPDYSLVYNLWCFGSVDTESNLFFESKYFVWCAEVWRIDDVKSSPTAQHTELIGCDSIHFSIPQTVEIKWSQNVLIFVFDFNCCQMKKCREYHKKLVSMKKNMSEITTKTNSLRVSVIIISIIFIKWDIHKSTCMWIKL